MYVFHCPKGCCNVYMKPYKRNEIWKPKTSYKKAGVFIYDPVNKQVLLVQSRGQYWGSPKGTIEFGESPYACAIREVAEETNINLSGAVFVKAIRIKGRATYFYHEMPMCDVSIRDDIPDNDVSAYAWIKIECLKECIKENNIVINNHCRILFQRFLGVDLDENDSSN